VVESLERRSLISELSLVLTGPAADEKLSSKVAWSGSRDPLFNFGTPSVYLETGKAIVATWQERMIN